MTMNVLQSRKGALVPKEHVERGLGVSAKREQTYSFLADWLNKWFSGNHSPDLSFHNQSYPKSLEALSMNDIKGDHLFPFVTRFGQFFANNALQKSRGAGVPDASTKLLYFKACRKTMYHMFPAHEYLQPGDTNIGWWTDLLACFKRLAEHTALKDPSQYNAVKSTALYRDTSTDVHAEDFSAWGGRDIWYSAAERSE